MFEESTNPSDSVTKDERKQSAATGSRIRWIVIALLLIAGSAYLIRSFWPGRPQAANEAQKTAIADADREATDRAQLAPEALQRAAIETQTVSEHTLLLELEANGRIQINEDASARIGTPTEGRVVRVTATVGDQVKAGQPLVYVHSHELVQAQADHARAVSTLTRAEKNLAYARAEQERARRLLELKAISQQEQMRAEADVNAAITELEQAKVELRRSEEYLEHLGVSPGGPDDVVIRSPISGVVIKREVTLGTVVSPAADLMVMANLSTLWAVAEVPEKQAALVRPGQPVWLTVQAFADKRFAGRVVHIGASLNAETRTTQVRCLIENPHGQLRPEMYATIHLSTGRTAPMLAIPRDAVQEMQGQRVVFIALNDGVFEKRVVQTGREQNDQIEITNGLKAGERIVTRGGFFIKSEFLKGSLSEE
jgi:cobalt-zinc-cadmium efflux system membrane fusion protein